jgi:hypothetical protein
VRNFVTSQGAISKMCRDRPTNHLAGSCRGRLPGKALETLQLNSPDRLFMVNMPRFFGITPAWSSRSAFGCATALPCNIKNQIPTKRKARFLQQQEAGFFVWRWQKFTGAG